MSVSDVVQHVETREAYPTITFRVSCLVNPAREHRVLETRDSKPGTQG